MNLNEIINSAKYTVLLGKNGSGKSTQLRQISNGNLAQLRYISPERGGTLRYDPNIDNNISSNEHWLSNTRNRNRYEQFREQSAAQFRNLELLILREIEKDKIKRSDIGYSFEQTLEKINSILPAIKLVRSDRGFSIQSKSGLQISEDQISSGESELIALAIELLVFSKSEIPDKTILLDEPDVHLHPDLQHRFIKFVEEVSSENTMRVVIATHSTAIIGSFSESADLLIVPITNRDQDQFKPFRREKVSKEIIPIFGSHPLSNVFNNTPAILVEGEDDRRVIDQIVKSSNGRVKLFPCVVGSVSDLGIWERWLNDILPSIYDNPKGYSLRDLDESLSNEINDIGIVCRAKLNCYAIENILLTSECLNAHSFSEELFLKSLCNWSEQFSSHKYKSDIDYLVTNFSNRRKIKIKNIRNIIVSILETNKPWEVVVGQLIANCSDNENMSNQENSINNYLGQKAYSILSGISFAP